MLRRSAVRQRPLRAPGGRGRGGPGGLPGGFQGVHEVEDAGVSDQQAGAAGEQGEVPLLRGEGVEHDGGEDGAEERVEAARVARGQPGVLRLRQRAPAWELLVGALV